MRDISIVVPSIRPQNLIKFYKSVQNACKKYSFELIIPSPYIIPEELMTSGNVTFLHTYANATIAFQQAALLSNGDYIYNTTDDGLLQEDAIDIALDMFKNGLKSTDIVNMIYNEGDLDPETLEPYEIKKSYHPSEYWFAYFHGDLRFVGILPNWKISLHYLMKRDYFFYLGGYDCRFEYSNHSIHDLIFRAQANGSKVIDLPKVAFVCSHLPNETGDHGPIHIAQNQFDLPKFAELYQNPLAAFSRIRLEYDNWRSHPNIWTRRFDPNNLKINKI